MKLYATARSERAEKSQGGNEYIDVLIKDASKEVAGCLIVTPTDSGGACIIWQDRDGQETPLMVTKGKREKGKTMRQQIREDLREEREHDAFSSGMQ